MTQASAAVGVVTRAGYCSADVLRALIFDLDGTLYENAPLRRAMLYRLLQAHVADPLEGFRVLRALQSYREAQELLRKDSAGFGDIAAAQLRLASQLTQVGERKLALWVTRWMEQEPLPLLSTFMRKGTVELLQNAKRAGLQLAVCSDYPAREKLAAMGIERFFDAIVTARDPGIQRLKPHPIGLQEALRRLRVRNSEAIYIGDRPDVDGEAASRAGVQTFILRSGRGFRELCELLMPSACPAP